MADVIIWMSPDGPRNIEEMTREELIQAVRGLISDLDHSRASSHAARVARAEAIRLRS